MRGLLQRSASQSRIPIQAEWDPKLAFDMEPGALRRRLDDIYLHRREHVSPNLPETQPVSVEIRSWKWRVPSGSFFWVAKSLLTVMLQELSEDHGRDMPWQKWQVTGIASFMHWLSSTPMMEGPFACRRVHGDPCPGSRRRHREAKKLRASMDSIWFHVNVSNYHMLKHAKTCSLQTPGSPTLKQHIQTIWYTHHQMMNENTGYTQWFRL